ncbi:uncharacterized protein LOC132205884 [Neocloeon triangulifer]|uniref:uncharacterized protein LOC132205884 n=1 Tax=Neocloeon triangulifer TaxID=2078957 RepID=UPI00286EEBC0|nr:uncharacterized protein LOC132205884 [Neocloeon triangulifer]
MGNKSTHNAGDEAALDSRVIKISESVAHRLLVPREPQIRTIVIESSASESASSTAPPKPFRRDPSVIGEDVYNEFEKQDRINELQMESLSKKLKDAAKAFDQQPIASVAAASKSSSELDNVSNCLRGSNGASLNCQAEVVEFVSFVENNTYPVAAN